MFRMVQYYVNHFDTEAIILVVIEGLTLLWHLTTFVQQRFLNQAFDSLSLITEFDTDQ